MVRAGKLKSGAAKKVNRWSSSSTANARTNRHRREAMAKKGLIKNYEEHDPKGLSKDKLRLLDKMTGADTRSVNSNRLGRNQDHIIWPMPPIQSILSVF